jgi:hypothetical protein
VKEMKNPNEMQQPAEKSLWLAHTTGLWIHVIYNKKQASKGLKKITNDAR